MYADIPGDFMRLKFETMGRSDPRSNVVIWVKLPFIVKNKIITKNVVCGHTDMSVFTSVSPVCIHRCCLNLSQMAVCLTHASGEWIAAVLQMDPGSAAHALLVSVEMVPIVKT